MYFSIETIKTNKQTKDMIRVNQEVINEVNMIPVLIMTVEEIV